MLVVTELSNASAAISVTLLSKRSVGSGTDGEGIYPDSNFATSIW